MIGEDHWIRDQEGSIIRLQPREVEVRDIAVVEKLITVFCNKLGPGFGYHEMKLRLVQPVGAAQGTLALSKGKTYSGAIAQSQLEEARLTDGSEASRRHIHTCWARAEKLG